MDCEKVESVLMDELYGDLDELTSAALRRHVAGCARCSALLDGFRATRQLAALPLVEPPHSLEARVLDAALPRAAAVSRAVPASEDVSFGRRLARIVSIAGSWAMRPQTAMAALFLVMVGAAVPLLRGKSSRAAANAEIRVTEQGMPAPAATAAPIAPSAAAEPPPAPVAQVARPSDVPGSPKPAAHAATAEEFRELATGKGEARDREHDKDSRALRERTPSGALAENTPSRKAYADSPAGAGVAGGGPAARPAPAFAAAPPAAPPSPPAAPVAAAAAAPASNAAADDVGETNPFDAALSAYRAHRYAEASRAFEALAAGDPNADLWAARSLREASGCGAAASRFDQVARRAAGTPAGWDALLEGAQCYRGNGDVPTARARLIALLGVPGYKDRAQAELDRLARGRNGM